MVTPDSPGPYPPEPPAPPPRKGTSAIVWLLALFGVGTVLFFVAAGVFVAVVGKNAMEQAKAGALVDGGGAPLPPVERRVPNHPMSVLDGCSDTDLETILDRINDAISVGAPAYNAGNFALCYRTYERTAEDVERALPATCEGPRKALAAGRRRAAGLPSPSAQAWAMRDAFDGLDRLIARHGDKQP